LGCSEIYQRAWVEKWLTAQTHTGTIAYTYHTANQGINFSILLESGEKW